MSSFIVSDNHINAVLTYLKNNSEKTPYFFNSDLKNELEKNNIYVSNSGHINDDALSYLGLKILRENEKQTNFRYKDSNIKEYNNFIYSNKFKFIPYKKEISGPQFLKLIQCINYQCSESDNYYKSDVYKFLDNLIKWGIDTLDGYDDAEWCIE